METNINGTKCKKLYFKEREGDEFVLYKKAYAKKSDKNLLKNTAVSQTINGVDFVVNADGTVVANGTATADIQFILDDTFIADADGAYILNGCPNSGSSSTYYLKYHEWNSEWTSLISRNDKGDGVIIGHKDEAFYTSARIVILSGATLTNVIFKPMIRLASIEDDTYEPYEDWTLIYSAGNPVTYVVDTGVEYTEEVDSGATCLSPVTFTPTKDGYAFVGWRKDTTASGEVETDLVMGDEPMTLYAVFSKDVTLTYAGNGATSGSVAAETKQIYYNNGNVVNSTFTLAANGFTRTSYTFIGWDLGAVGATVEYTEDATCTAQWTVTTTSFNYTGAMQAYTVPVTGRYLLEAWGASGGACVNNGATLASGGYGGYAKGTVWLEAGKILYICVGGAGSSGGGSTYNGGGAGATTDYNSGKSGAGGGCTHIGLKNYLMSQYTASNYANNVYIVAGGGGGAGGNLDMGSGYSGGAGGNSASYAIGKGEAGYAVDAGGTASSSGYRLGGGGGGGLYGGANANESSTMAGSAGGGGSSFLNGLGNSSTTPGARSGNGAAAITFYSLE